MPYEIEHTDTFAGEANYCWVRRETIQVPETIPYGPKLRRYLVRKAKAFAGFTGMRCRVDEYACDDLQITPVGRHRLLQTVFVTWQEET